MTPPRYTDLNEDRREHCEHHDHHSDTIEKNANSLAGILASMSILKWVIGLGLPIFIAIFGAAATMVDAKMTGITSELKDIKAAVNSIAMDQVQVKSELENVKWRLDQLEAKQ